MKRKIIQLAGKTLVISLPNKWAVQRGIKKGQEIDIEEQGSNLLIKTNPEPEFKTISVDASKYDEQSLKWLLSALHKKGYDEIELLYEKPETTKVIQNMIKNVLLGFIIVEQSQRRCVIRSVSRDVDSEFESALRRAFLVTLNLAEGALKSIEEKETKHLSEIISLEQTNNQLTNFCERILIKKGVENQSKTIFLYVVSWNLEKVCDEYKNLCVYLSKQKDININKEVIALFKDVNQFLRMYYELFYSFNTAKLNEFSRANQFVFEKAQSLFSSKNIKPLDLAVTNQLITISSKINDFAASTVGLNSQ